MCCCDELWVKWQFCFATTLVWELKTGLTFNYPQWSLNPETTLPVLPVVFAHIIYERNISLHIWDPSTLRVIQTMIGVSVYASFSFGLSTLVFLSPLTLLGLYLLEFRLSRAKQKAQMPKDLKDCKATSHSAKEHHWAGQNRACVCALNKVCFPFFHPDSYGKPFL